MSNVLKIALYFVGTLLLGAALAPPLYWGGHALGVAWHPVHWLAEIDFQRYFDRAMFVAAIALLWPLVRSLRVTTWRELGLQHDSRAWQHVLFGFVAAGGLLWLLGLFLWSQGIYAPRRAVNVTWGAFPGFLLAAVAVACAEEAFFRGALLGVIARTMRPVAAVVFVSALFAVLHFLKPPEGVFAHAAVDALAGFRYLPKVFWQWGDLRLVLGGFATLLAVGLVLGYARVRTRALWLPIGLHAGWVFGVKTFSATSKHMTANSVWFGEDLRHGLVPVFVVLLTGYLVKRRLSVERLDS